MIKSGVHIVRASESDIDGIVALLTENQPERGGTLSANPSYFKIAEMIREMPIIVARRGNRITGFLLTSTKAMMAEVPIISAMLNVYPGTDDAYVYGPICVRDEERGKGVAQAMFLELCRLVPTREGILFIRRDNSASLRAHEKMGMTAVVGFVFGGIDFVVFSYFG